VPFPLRRTFDLIILRDVIEQENIVSALKAMLNFAESGSKYIAVSYWPGSSAVDNLKGFNVGRRAALIPGRWYKPNLVSEPFDFPQPLVICENHDEGQSSYAGKTKLGVWSLKELSSLSVLTKEKVASVEKSMMDLMFKKKQRPGKGFNNDLIEALLGGDSGDKRNDYFGGRAAADAGAGGAVGRGSPFGIPPLRNDGASAGGLRKSKNSDPLHSMDFKQYMKEIYDRYGLGVDGGGRGGGGDGEEEVSPYVFKKEVKFPNAGALVQGQRITLENGKEYEVIGKDKMGRPMVKLIEEEDDGGDDDEDDDGGVIMSSSYLNKKKKSGPSPIVKPFPAHVDAAGGGKKIAGKEKLIAAVDGAGGGDGIKDLAGANKNKEAAGNNQAGLKKPLRDDFVYKGKPLNIQDLLDRLGLDLGSEEIDNDVLGGGGGVDRGRLGRRRLSGVDARPIDLRDLFGDENDNRREGALPFDDRVAPKRPLIFEKPKAAAAARKDPIPFMNPEEFKPDLEKVAQRLAEAKVKKKPKA
jgi:hypothetical protein